MSETSSPTPAQPPRSPSQYVEEASPFLALFPHRFDYIHARLPFPSQRPEWLTVSEHPLSDRLIQQGGMLYGVSFGKTTRYLLLDIDFNSPYHPRRDPYAIPRLLAALELLGITRSIKLTSSYSKGLHIYLPFDEAQSSGALALAAETLLEKEGFKIAPGQLELFPDPKPFIPNAAPRRYAAHRLPLQQGSYLLDENWEPCFSSQEMFVSRWLWCCEGNAVTQKKVQWVLNTYRRRQHQITARAAKFLNDLNTEIEQGWTGHGQTNRLLGRIAMREYIFGHILYGEGPLEGIDLVQQIVRTATALPGYEEWCRHKHEIAKRAEDWARCIESSRYFHYGAKSSRLSTLSAGQEETEETSEPSWNERQQQAAREKISQAIAQMLNSNTLPATTTERFKALSAMKISGNTLYRHRDLWHPEHLRLEVEEENGQPVENFGANSAIRSGRVESSRDSTQPPKSLLASTGCNTPQGKDSSDLKKNSPQPGCNVPPEQLSIFNAVQQAARQEAWEQRDRIKKERQQQQYIEKMQQWLESGDPILMAEAIAWAEQNPGLL